MASVDDARYTHNSTHHATLHCVLDALPWARQPEEIWMEADSVAEEAHTEAVSKARIHPGGDGKEGAHEDGGWG